MRFELFALSFILLPQWPNTIKLNDYILRPTKLQLFNLQSVIINNMIIANWG